MVKVKLFGLLRLDTGLKELELEANSVKELYPLILEAAHSARPGTAVTLKDPWKNTADSFGSPF